MNDLLLNTLHEFGLQDKEVRIYLALLELELATVFELAKHTGINRSSAYVVLEALKKKGLVGITDDKKVRRYVAVSPDVLAQMAQASWKKHETIKDNMLSILPELKGLHKGAKRKPVVRVYEGKEGLVQVLVQILGSREKLLRYSASANDLLKHVPEYLAIFGQKRLELRIKIYTILPDTKQSLELLSTSPKNYKAALVPKSDFSFVSDFAVWDDYVVYVLYSIQSAYSILIESKDLAQNMKKLFDMAFENASLRGRIVGDIVR